MLCLLIHTRLTFNSIELQNLSMDAGRNIFVTTQAVVTKKRRIVPILLSLAQTNDFFDSFIVPIFLA